VLESEALGEELAEVAGGGVLEVAGGGVVVCVSCAKAGSPRAADNKIAEAETETDLVHTELIGLGVKLISIWDSSPELSCFTPYFRATRLPNFAALPVFL
jgi:hypothetical protein